MISPEPIYLPWHSAFGDQIATLNLLIQKAQVTGRRSLLHSAGNLRHMHLELLEVLEDKNRIILVFNPPTHQLSGYDIWAATPARTKEQWYDRGLHPYITYQVDGVSSANDKNPSAEDLNVLLTWLNQSGFEPVALGKHLSIAACVDLLTKSACFIGVDSGMSHLAHAVGTPMFLLEFKLPIVTTHRGKKYIHCQGIEDLLRHKYPTWIDLLRFVEHPDGEKSTVVRGRSAREARPGAWWRLK